MALITFKDLCIDAVDPHALGRFWGPVLGLEVETFDDDGDARLHGPDKKQTIWVNTVPEAKTVKQRVHLDIVAASHAPFEGLARLTEPGQYPWTQFADPEGGEFCVFERDSKKAYKLKDVVVDAVDHAAIATWWADVFGAKAIDDDGYSYVSGIAGLPFGDFDFVPVEEPKTVKNRIHWDVTLTEGATVDDLVARGAQILALPDEENRWTVMADPEGNEFCVFAA